MGNQRQFYDQDNPRGSRNPPQRRSNQGQGNARGKAAHSVNRPQQNLRGESGAKRVSSHGAHSGHRISAQQYRANQRRRAKRRVLVVVLVGILLCLLAWVIVNRIEGKQPGASLGVSSAVSSAASSAPQTASGTQSVPEAPSSTASQALPPEGDGEWKLRLVNASNPLPEGYAPELGTLANGMQFDARAIDALKTMLADAKAAGLSPIVCSSYRSVARQDALFEQMKQDYIAQGLSEEDAYAKTATIRTPHGCSEHSSGLAADIVALDYQTLDDGFEDTPEAQWLHAHAAEYGFILRYPKGKTEVTGIIYEPWHFRYVGVENAAKIRDSGLCLEEYLAQNS